MQLSVVAEKLSVVYLSRLRRDSVGACFVTLISIPAISMNFSILAVKLLNHNGLKYY